MKKKAAVYICTFISAASLITGCGSSSGSSASKMSDNSMAYMESDYSDSSVSMYSAEAAGDTGDSIGSVSLDGEGTEISEEAGETTADAEETARKLIRTMNIETETESFDEFIAGIEKKTAELGGYVESSSIYGGSNDSRSAYYTLRIPEEKADSFIEEVGGESNITSRSENVEDITLTYVDIASRKEALETEYSRLEEMMKTAETVEDIIAIEDRMSEVRYEIDSIESQLRTYDNKIDYTTINVTVYEVKDYTEQVDPDPTYFERLTRSMKSAFTGLWEFLQSLSIFLIVAIPVLAILAVPIVLFVLLVRWIVKKIRKLTGKNRTDVPKPEKAKKKGGLFRGGKGKHDRKTEPAGETEQIKQEEPAGLEEQKEDIK